MRNGERIKELLDEQGRTKKWLAQQCGIQVSTVTRIVSGHTNPGRPLVKLMALKLGVDESEIIDSEKGTTESARAQSHRRANARVSSAS